LHIGEELDDGVSWKVQQPAHVPGVVAMITLIAAGIGFIVVVAIVVGIVDATQAPAWRRVAAQRRREWESQQPEFHGIDAADVESWDDD
jgi:Flp pilus assembly protein TadB